MGYANKEELYFNAKSLAEDFNGPKFETRNQSCGVIELTWSGAAATDAVVKVQESVGAPDTTAGWKDISGKSTTISAASGYDVIHLNRDELLAPYIRLVIVDNSESAGTVTAKIFLKGDR